MMKTLRCIKRFSLLSLSCIFISLLGHAADLNVKITNKSLESGTLYLELYKAPTIFEHKENWQRIVSIGSHTYEVTGDEENQFFELKIEVLGIICARSFLDLNANGKLDRSPMGLPKEPVGFANNPALMLGEPAPSDACFKVTAEPYQLHIKLQQKKRNKP